MNTRFLPFLVVGLVITLVCGSAIAADKDQVYKGTIASVDKDSLALRVDKQQHNFIVGENTKVTLDGKKAELADLKAGHQATVTWEKRGAKLFAKMIDATSSRALTANLVSLVAADEVFEGKIVSAAERGVALDVDGQQRNFLVDAKTAITLDGKEAKLSDLKAGHLAKVTAVKKGKQLLAKTIAAKSAE